MGGIDVETLKSHNFKRYPFVDIRYCSSCGMFWKITITNIKNVPQYEQMVGSIPFVSAKSFFPLIHVSGRKIRKP